MSNKWIGVDLDGTLAMFTDWKGDKNIGAPIVPMVDKVKQWIKEGKTVKVFTARADSPESVKAIEEWTQINIGTALPVTNVKDKDMEVLYDDRAVNVQRNTGIMKLNKSKVKVFKGLLSLRKLKGDFIPLDKSILPTEAQAKAGNYKKDHYTYDTLKLSIENPKGSIRKGIDKEGTPWEIEMQDDYGYILGVKGRDGDFLDCFVNSDSPDDVSKLHIYIMEQVNKEDGSLDEYKTMLGYGSQEEAQNAYLRNYDPAWYQLGNIYDLTLQEFKESIGTGYLRNIKLEKRIKLKKDSIVKLRKAASILIQNNS